MITSYAQNFEDVMLWRALQHVDNGFYIDVGANDPDVESVTRLFYEHGWTGINIEPVEQWFRRLKEIRTRDINLKLAVGASSGEITLYDVPDTGLCTIDKATAERHEKDKGYEKNAFRAELRTLAEICESYFRPEIHFLKIDVERAELQVIQGMDFARFRPWIVVVEATLPNLPTEDYAAWEPLLVESDYRLVYLDGLNRFYVAEEKYTDLVGCFQSPPNVFDQFVLADVVNARLESERAQQEAASLSNALDSVRGELKIEREVTDQLRESILRLELFGEAKSAEVAAMLSSLSWRITSPLRWLAGPLMGDGESRPALWKRPVDCVLRWAMAQPALVKGVHFMVDLAPPLRRFITSRVSVILEESAGHSALAGDNGDLEKLLAHESRLTPHARRIEREIEAAISRASGGTS